jgi:transposase-like protein
MSTSSANHSLPQAQFLDELERMVSAGLGEMSIAEALGLALSALGKVERSAYLHSHSDDKGNGTYERGVEVGSVPLTVEVARTRNRAFRPSLLPALYQRGFTDTQRELLMGLLTSSRSLNAVKAALKRMGLSHCEEDLEALGKEFLEEFELRNTRPIDPDMLALYIDGKHVEFRDGERIRACCIYLVVGLARDGKKSILSCTFANGKESLEQWKKVLRSLLERGLRRVLLIVQDDFPGLLSLNKGLFPQADVQLCIVHMQRNAKNHLSKEDNIEFQQRMRTIKACWDAEKAALEFDDLCNRFASSSPHFIAELRNKREHYLVFLQYPEAIRRTFSTTNAVEAVNGQLERLRRNNGGYFQSEQILKIKLGLSIRFLEDGSWQRPAASVRAALHQLNLKFTTRFESSD